MGKYYRKSEKEPSKNVDRGNLCVLMKKVILEQIVDTVEKEVEMNPKNTIYIKGTTEPE